jgi:predicted amidohydrolase YtcJ
MFDNGMGVLHKRPIPDLLLINANIITLNPVQPEASWVAIGDGKIVGLGGPEELMLSHIAESEIIDCRGKTVLPGFIDAHLHLLSFAESLVTLDLKHGSGIRSIADMQSKILSWSQDMPPGAWIRGGGYNEFHLTEKRHPNRWDLDEVAQNHPVKLNHRSGHAHILNSFALKLAGITRETSDPPGGIIERDLDTGMPTGLLYEMGDFLSARIPPLDKKEVEKGIKMADQELISCGITSIHDASSRNDRERWNLFKSWKERGMVHPRLHMMLGVAGFEEQGLESFSTPVEPDKLQVNAVKILLDETTGRLHPPQATLDDLVLRIHASGMQVAIHAIEEKAIESACIAIENALKQIPRSDHRHRIEHCSICPPSLAEHIARLGIGVVTQPAFLYCNGDRYLETVEYEQLRHLYPFGSLLRSRIRVAGSSDCPFASLNPLIAIYAAVSRRSENGKRVMQNEGIRAIDALRMYTEYGAEITFTEGIKGSISPGKLADLAVLNGDPVGLPPDEVKDLKVEMTIINGRVVWDGGH